jgi:hypothetical protein
MMMMESMTIDDNVHVLHRGGLKRASEEQGDKVKRLQTENKKLRVETADEIRRMAAEEGGELFLLTPHCTNCPLRTLHRLHTAH